MQMNRLAPAFLLVVTLCLNTAGAAGLRDALLVSPAWLAQHLTDPDLVLLHVGERAQYAARHLPNARFVALDEISVSDRSGKGLILEMPPAGMLRERLAALGIGDRSRIVVYWAQEWVSPATRVVFTLDYAGLGDRTAVLDGGLDAWVSAGGKVTDAPAAVRAGVLSPLETRPIVVDAAYVLAHAKDRGMAIVDARSPAFYDGTQTGGGRGMPHKTGHIAGAVNVPFSSVVDDRTMLRSPQELTALFTTAGVKPGDTVIAYCHIGQQATAVLFAARTLGHRVLLYDGSFEDWSRQPDAPVETKR
jgi:thiosulfate/3-mercaptopyruvate sulfurtransferase